MQGIPQKEKDDPVVLAVGTQVSAKYKGAFCEAKVRTIVKNIKVRVSYKKGGTGNITDDEIIGEIRVGSVVEVREADKKESQEATITKIQDCSQYTVVFDDGDITTLRRSALCRQSGKHFNACDTLDQLPLTHPEHRGNTSKRSKTQDEWSDEDEEYAIGKVICVENTDTKKKARESYFPALVVAPKAQETAKIHIKTEYLVRSFKDGRYYTVPKKEVTEFSNDTAQKADIVAVSAAREYLDKNVLPAHWDREVLIDSACLSEQELSDSSDDEPNEVKDRFFAQLLEFMEKRNSPLNKGPSITNRDVDLYRLYYSVEKFGGYANVTKIHNWKAIAKRLGFMPTDAIVKLVKHSYRKFLLAFEEAVSKGIEELPPRTNRDKARSSSTRSGSVASPKVPESTKSSKKSIDKPSTSSIADDSENTSESMKLTSTRKLSTASNKVKTAVEKIEKAEKVEKPFEKVAESSPKEIVERIKKEEKPVVVKEEEPTPSTSPVPSLTKKEKFKKKPPEVKKKKEEVTEKKEVAVSASKVAHSGPIIPDDVPIEVDDRLKVYYRGSSDYEAKVLEISAQDGKPIYRVHYKGWNARYDEWIHRESIAENLTKDEPKKKSGSAASKSSTPSAGGSTSSLTTPTSKNAKRARNRADTTASSRSTTPLSNTSGKGKTAQKRVTRGAPANKTPRRTSSLNDDNSSESDEPIKKPVGKDDKKDDGKSSGVRKSASSDLNEIRSELKKEVKTEKEEGGSKSDDEKSTKSSIKSRKSPFDVKAKLKNLQRDSSRSSFHSTDSDSSHSVPSDVPNSSKSAYTSDNESNGPDKLPPAVIAKAEAKKSSFRFDDDSSDVKAGVASFFDKMGEKSEVKPGDAAIFTSKKPNIFQEKKLTQQRTMTSAAADNKVGRFGQLDKSATKETAKGKPKEGKPAEKSAESDVYDFKDEEFSDTKAPPPAKKQETPPEGLTKKQQLAQNRKQARLLKEAQDTAAASSGSPMEDIESMIKTSIVQSNKKRKKSPSKEEKSQQSMIVARTPANPPQASPVQPAPGNYSGWTPVRDNYSKPGGSSMPPKGRNDSTFDVLRKSPNFNMHVGDDFPIAKPQAFPSAGQKAASKALFGSQEMEPHDLLKPIMVPTNEDEKPELEAFKKILEPSFDALPKPEKSTSIADKLLKSMNKEAELSHQASVITKKEEVKVEPKGDPYTFKDKAPVTQLGAGKKPLLVSSEIKTDEKTKNNAELQGIIQKLESAIQRSATPIGGGLDLGSSDVSSHFAAIKKQADDSDTDSDPRLVIEDEVETVEKKKSLLESMMHDEVQYKHGSSSSSHKEEAEKKVESGEQQSETMSLLLCEETIPGSPAPVPVKDPLSEIGRSPSSTSGGFVHPPTMPSQSSNYMKYPGSITTALLHQQYQSSASHQTNLKQIPMDIDTDVHEAATGDILRDKLKSERGSATSSGNNTNNNSDNSPRDSNDDQSDNEKNPNKSDVTPKKKKRGMKPEPDSSQKRRRPQPVRNANVRGNLQGNDSGSDDNSDVNAFTSSRSQSETGCVSSSGKMQFNFLVELDPNMSSNQRINILVKKIQELKKTYLMIKNEMNAKDRRRKKLRRRERENKQKQIAKVA